MGLNWLRSIHLRYLGWRWMTREMVQVLSTSLGLEVQSETWWDFWAEGSNWSLNLLSGMCCGTGNHLKWGVPPESSRRPLLGGTVCSDVTVMHYTASAVVSIHSTMLGYMSMSHVLQSMSVNFALSLGRSEIFQWLWYFAFLQCSHRRQLWLQFQTEALFLSRLTKYSALPITSFQ